MVIKNLSEMKEGEHTMARGELWVVKPRLKDDGKTKELMLVAVDNPSKTWNPPPDREFEVISDVMEETDVTPDLV